MINIDEVLLHLNIFDSNSTKADSISKYYTAQYNCGRLFEFPYTFVKSTIRIYEDDLTVANEEFRAAPPLEVYVATWYCVIFMFYI